MLLHLAKLSSFTVTRVVVLETVPHIVLLCLIRLTDDYSILLNFSCCYCLQFMLHKIFKFAEPQFIMSTISGVLGISPHYVVWCICMVSSHI